MVTVDACVWLGETSVTMSAIGRPISTIAVSVGDR